VTLKHSGIRWGWGGRERKRETDGVCLPAISISAFRFPAPDLRTDHHRPRRTTHDAGSDEQHVGGGGDGGHGHGHEARDRRESEGLHSDVVVGDGGGGVQGQGIAFVAPASG
jgi:hypothetical protein